MSCVASVLIDDRTVTVCLSSTEKIEALRGNLMVPRTAVVQARAVPDGLTELHGPRMTTGWPGVSTVGTVRDLPRTMTASQSRPDSQPPHLNRSVSDMPFHARGAACLWRIVVAIALGLPGSPDQRD